MAKTRNILFFILLLAGVSFAESSTSAKVDIFLLRNSVASNELVRLADVAVLRGDEKLCKMAGQVGLGLLSMPGQEMVVDKATVYARLASNGFDKKQINLIGADSASIKREQTVITSEKIIEVAEKFAKKELKNTNIAQFRAVSRPSDFVMDGKGAKITLKPQVSYQRPGRIAVKVSILDGGLVKGTKTVSFDLNYKTKQLVASRFIPAGTVISEKDVKVKEVVVARPSDETIVSVVGKVARNRINAGRVINENMVADAKPEVVIKRNQLIEIRYETPVLLVTALGEAQEDGTVGGLIKVANVRIDDKGKAIKGRIIVARVQSDGTVIPAY